MKKKGDMLRKKQKLETREIGLRKYEFYLIIVKQDITKELFLSETECIAGYVNIIRPCALHCDVATEISPQKIFDSPTKQALQKVIAYQKLRYRLNKKRLQDNLGKSKKRFAYLESVIKALNEQRLSNVEQLGVLESNDESKN